MWQFLKALCGVMFGFSGGLVISGAVFAFIAVIGVVPRLAQKTNTMQYVMLYEEAIIFGGIIGITLEFVHFTIPMGAWLAVLVSLSFGIFFGVLAVSLAEVLNVIPVLTRRARVQKGMFFFIAALAIGKMAGSIAYYVIPGFFKAD